MTKAIRKLLHGAAWTAIGGLVAWANKDDPKLLDHLVDLARSTRPRSVFHGRAVGSWIPGKSCGCPKCVEARARAARADASAN